ncbi:uncharacterized protein LOC143251039 [Tachypleus tridentatus]|uniref:uncharacterized protein LOC143251038 n=1 Tax=Tachypleus tridentatus TaxID=6853 RepID=UPI003FD367E6
MSRLVLAVVVAVFLLGGFCMQSDGRRGRFRPREVNTTCLVENLPDEMKTNFEDCIANETNVWIREIKTCLYLALEDVVMMSGNDTSIGSIIDDFGIMCNSNSQDSLRPYVNCIGRHLRRQCGFGGRRRAGGRNGGRRGEGRRGEGRRGGGRRGGRNGG